MVGEPFGNTKGLLSVKLKGEVRVCVSEVRYRTRRLHLEAIRRNGGEEAADLVVGPVGIRRICGRARR